MKRLIHAAFGAIGLQITKKQDRYGSLEHFFATVKNLGFEPTYIIDVGANHGEWTRKSLIYYPNAAVTMIEPQEHLKVNVQDLLTRPNIKWITAGAGSENKVVKFTIAERDDSSTFVLSEQEAAKHGMKQIDMQLVTLNKVVADNGSKIPELIKIDAEGLDLDVIDGASDLIGKTEIILLEAAVCAHGIDNKISLTISKMNELGYQPFDITDLNYSPRQGILWLVEIVFVRNGGVVMSKTSSQY
jgi:FkbM family methyltransferase